MTTNQPQNLSSTTKMAATGWSFKARYSGKRNQNATQSHYANPQRLRKQFLAPHDSAPPRENCGQKALHSETSLQSLTQAHPRPATTTLKALRRSWRQALPSQD
ncbi:hypothetical protein PS2_046273 [Malus domestica]